MRDLRIASLMTDRYYSETMSQTTGRRARTGRVEKWLVGWPFWLRRIVLGLYGVVRWWVSVIVVAVHRFDQHDGNMRAAAIAYFGLISFFPLVLMLIIIISFFLETPLAQQQVIQFVEANVPTSVDLIRGNMEHLLRYRGTVGFLAVLGFLWSASAVFSTVDRALNRIWDVPVLRPYWRSKLIAVLVIIAIGLLSATSIGTTALVNLIRRVILPMLESRFEIDVGLWDFFVLIIPYISSIFLFMLIYWIFPHTRVSWLDVWPGGVFAGVLWEEAKVLFADYLIRFGRNNLVYGSVGTIIALLVWFYLTALILLMGAELSASYSRALRRTSTSRQAEADGEPA